MIYSDVGLPREDLVNIIITEKTRRGVAFLSRYVGRTLEPVGTAFFLSWPWGGRQDLIYAVTARHCLAGIDTELFLELTDQHGKYRRIQTLPAEWTKSEDTDVACRLLEDNPVIDINRVHAFGSDAALEAGYEVYIVGLFSKSYSRGSAESIEPIVRFGRVAHPSMNAPVYFDPRDEGKEGKQVIVRAILIESISFGGESGAPVFICEDFTQDPPSARNRGWVNPPRNVRLTDQQVPTHLLGLVSAHWKISSPVKTKTRGKSVAQVGLNSGIAVVIPVNDILGFIMKDPQLKAARERIPQRSGSEPTSPLSNVSESEDRFTKEDFEDALKRASRRIQPSPPDEGKSGT